MNLFNRMITLQRISNFRHLHDTFKETFECRSGTQLTERMIFVVESIHALNVYKTNSELPLANNAAEYYTEVHWLNHLATTRMSQKCSYKGIELKHHYYASSNLYLQSGLKQNHSLSVLFIPNLHHSIDHQILPLVA